MLVLSLIVETTNGFYYSILRVYGKEFGVSLFDRICDLLLCVRIIGLKLIALALNPGERPILIETGFIYFSFVRSDNRSFVFIYLFVCNFLYFFLFFYFIFFARSSRFFIVIFFSFRGKNFDRHSPSLVSPCNPGRSP